MTAQTTFIGDRMYGDGEIVVEFENVGASWAPLAAIAFAPSGRSYSCTFGLGQKPSMKLAAQVVASVRLAEARVQS